MKKRKPFSTTQKRLVASAAAILLLLIEWVIIHSATFAKCIEEQANQRAAQQQHLPPYALALAHDFGFWLACNAHVVYDTRDIFTVFSTILLAAFTYRIWTGADDTLKHQVESTEREQRGYVFFSDKGWVRPGAYFALQFKNFGHTPVKDVEVIGYISAAKRDHVGRLPKSPRATDTFRTMLGPQVPLDAAFTMRLSDKLATKILQKKLIAYFHGVVNYTDAFKVRRWTKFRYCRIDDVLYNCTEGNDWY